MHRYREPEERPGELVGQLARRLAREEIVAAGRGRPRRFRRRLRELEHSLASLHRRFRESEEMRDLHPRIAEWLLDNTYLTRGALRHVQDSLSPGFLRDLPKLTEPETRAGRPRVRVLASSLVEHSRAELDVEDILRFVRAFQEISYLSLGELWALPPMLQLGVLETLDSVVRALPSPEISSDSVRDDDAITGASEPVRTVAACIESLRLITGYDWRSFVEAVSRVEATLRRDPAEVYERMDPESRDRYRRTVEEIARGCGGYEAETHVAEHAVRRARDACSSGGVARKCHVGHHLIDAGREELERELECRPSWKSRRRRWIRRHAQSLYLASVGVATVGALAVLGVVAGSLDMDRMSILLILIAGLVPAVTMAVSLVNWLAAHLVPTRILPKLEVKDRVPAEFRTVVALPVLIADRQELEELFGHLEVLRHANPLQGLSFVLLTDLPDAPERVMPGDAELVEMARRGIRELNAASDGARPFSLLHRERLWNAAEGCWMGWERKRGKLEEFNRFLLGAEDTGFVVREGDPERLLGARFVITLDADTILPPEAAGRLIGTLAHPLNRPEIAPDGRITAGYSVLQPRIDVMPRGGSETPFASLGKEADGLDLYSHAASDVYQDLFGEGLYAGKGIYDVHAFHASLQGRVPENAILSHDLFEGLHGRAGLASDIRVFEEYPGHVVAYLHRLHRWIRGDWQLLPWLGSKVPGKGGERLKTRFGRLDRWKVLDNLRRSLVAPSLLALLGVGWLTSGAAWIWPALILGVYALPVFLGAAGATRHVVRARRIRPRRHRTAPADLVRATWSASARAIGRWLVALLLLPHEALTALDAIGRTLYRIVVSRRHLLQWTSAAHANRRLHGGAQRATWTSLWQGPVVGIGIVALVAIGRPENLLVAVPVATAWIVSPSIAGFLSSPRPVRKEEMSAAGRRRLRSMALHTWYYFERLVDSEDNWLPPDNFRENQESGVARRTSPTNIGMMLGATQAAFDLGFVDVLLFEATIRNALDSIARLERYRGHLLNWYSTSDLRSLEPRYVSTVDSGNLAASLLTVSRGLQDAARRQPLGKRDVRGLCDSLTALRLAAHAACSSTRELAALDRRLEEAESELRSAENDPRRISAALHRMDETHLPAVEDALMGIMESPASTLDERRMGDLITRTRKLRQHVGTLQRLQRRLLPWLALSSDPAAADSPSALQDALGGAVRLCDLPAKLARIRSSLNHWEQQGAAEATQNWRSDLRTALAAAGEEAERVLNGLAESSAEMRAIVDEMDFRFLFDQERELFHIGYGVTAETADPHHYDLLASEARVASLLAIARRDVRPAHWLRLGRPFGRVRGKRVLLSWGATMFEYLLPALFTRMPEDSLLHHACRQAVRRQKDFGDEHGIPWGISESSYHGSGVDADYPYRAFGVPDLGLRRDLGERLVVAPYATMLALPVAPASVEENLERLDGLGMLGALGPYEALDFGSPTDHTAREPRIVRAYMAHHQGMILVAVDNHLNEDVMVERFHADPRIRAVEHLLHERVPWQVPARRAWARPEAPVRVRTALSPVVDWVADPTARRPDAHLLSNGRYSVLVTARGAGGSRWDGLAMTRWRADPTLERHGSWVYLCEPDTGEVWSATHSPTAREPESSSVRFAPHMVEMQRRDAGIFVRTGLTVADDDVELRHVRIANESERRRRLAVASYAEVVLGREAEDRRHPAYSKLFVESEALAHRRTLLFHRRRRSSDERPVHLGHALVGGDGSTTNFAWETDRAAFLGRGGDPAHPAALEGGRLGLSGCTGATLDPIYSLGCEVELAPYESVDLVFVTAAGASRSEVLRLLERYRSVHRCETAVDWARDRVALLLDRYDIAPRRARTIQRLFSGLVHRGPPAGPARSIETAGPSRSGLWKHGISGDDPILLVRVDAPEDTSLIYQLLRAHAYLLQQGARFDLVILDRAPSGYAQPLRDRLHSLLERAGSATLLGRPGGVHIVDLSHAEEAELQLLESSARVVVEDGEADFSLEPAPEGGPPAELPEFVPVPSAPIEPLETSPLPFRGELVAFNGIGGFSPDGREYVFRVGSGVRTPAPWANVVANPSFGFIVTEAGGGYTWALNAGENRLTPWRNDPVADLPGEVVYLRDEEIGDVWSVTPAPAGPTDGPEAACEVRHGAGYTTFHRRSNGLDQKLTLFCAPEDPVKIFRLRLTDLWQRQRRVTATCFVEWVLGTDPETAAPHVATGYDADEELILARNPFNDEFGSRYAFVGSSLPPHGVTTDRTEFLGRKGSHARPAALHRIGLSGWIGAAKDPCAAYQVHLDIPPGATTEVYFVLGQGENHEDAVRLARRYSEPDGAAAAFGDMTAAWDELLGTLTVETPEPELDVMLNRWLLYQTVSSRLWGRTGLYQSSGAFGFRDQLQDVVALLDAAPDLAREHLLRAAGRQFEEGDVLHWWQPGTATGVRTRCSDDLLWLPYATALYVKRTGDVDVLDEAVSFLRGEPLQAGEDERYGRYEAALRTGDLYEHCLRAIDRGATTGEHGLPLIGSGDWNDGFDRVGREGRGESVWLAWFLAGVLEEFAPLCEARDDGDRARSFRERAAELRSRVEETAWDGRWYHRAYYDDGTPLGSARNREGRIDAISQAWSVLAGAGEEERSRTAMEAVSEHLILDDERLVLLLTPPFDRTDRDPGYIKGYPPGIRENGGQYTHAAAWVGWAFAALGDSEAAGRVLGYLNPVLRASDPESVARYRVEPYVVAADIYGVQPHVGRGGWTWYTGSAAWLYRFAVEAVLGLRREADRLHVTPSLPPGWEGYRAELRHGSSRYRIDVTRTAEEEAEPVVVSIRVDGRDVGRGPVTLVDDGESHEVNVRVGPSPTAGLSEPRAG